MQFLKALFWFLLLGLAAAFAVTNWHPVEIHLWSGLIADVTVEGGRIVLTPVRVQKAQAVREKLEQLGITEQDVEDAVAWARQ